MAYLICMTTFFFVGVTIHFSHGIYAWFMFALGSGAWLVDTRQTELAMAAGNNLLAGDRLLSHWNARQQSQV
jgi:hypothetical protein